MGLIGTSLCRRPLSPKHPLEAFGDEFEGYWGSLGSVGGALEASCTRTPKPPCKRPQIPSNRDHMALKRGTLGGVGRERSYPPHEYSEVGDLAVSHELHVCAWSNVWSYRILLAGCTWGQDVPGPPKLPKCWTLYCLSILGYWAIILGSFGGPRNARDLEGAATWRHFSMLHTNSF